MVASRTHTHTQRCGGGWMRHGEHGAENRSKKVFLYHWRPASFVCNETHAWQSKRSQANWIHNKYIKKERKINYYNNSTEMRRVNEEKKRAQQELHDGKNIRNFIVKIYFFCSYIIHTLHPAGLKHFFPLISRHCTQAHTRLRVAVSTQLVILTGAERWVRFSVRASINEASPFNFTPEIF